MSGHWTMLGRRTRTVLRVFALAAVLGGALAPPAGAIIKRLPHGHGVSYMPLVGGVSFGPTTNVFATRAPASGAAPFDNTFNNVDYNGGPVMTSATIYPVYWAPGGLTTYPTGYTTGIDRYLTDLAHDSGGHQNTNSVDAQYNDAQGGRANYQVAFGGTTAESDTDPYPANGCSEGATCLIDTQLQAEVKSYAAAHSLPHGLSTIIALIFPPNVVTCFDSKPSDGCSANASADAAYCAYHGSFGSNASPFIYVNMDYVTGNSGCDDGNHPNNSPSDGALDGGFSHELNESITDPEVLSNTAWDNIENQGDEIGDQCASPVVFGTPLGTAPDGASYNQLINGHEYWYQEEWSNQGQSCLQRYTPTQPLPTASFTYNGAGGDNIALDASASTAAGGVKDYEWTFDGRSTSAGASGTSQEVTTPTTTVTPTLAAGSHRVSLTAFAGDGDGAGAAQTIQVPAATVTTTNPGAQTSAAGSPASLQVSATDSDSGKLTYSATGLPPGLTISTSSGLISGTPSKGGVFNVRVIATDSGPSQSVSFTWTIHAVSVTNPGAQHSTVGDAVSLPIHASASDGGTLSYSATGLPSGLSISPSSGQITGTPSTTGTSNAVVTVADSSGAPSSTAAFTWTVNQISFVDPGSQHATVGNPVSLQISASDSDGGKLTYAATGLPSGLSLGASTGKITGTPTTTGSFNVNVTVTDATGGSKTAHFTWTVNSITITRPAAQAGTLRSAASLQITASDSDGGALSYAATGLPPGLSIGSSTGKISGTPTGRVGVFSVTVTATDAKGGSRGTTFSWTIRPPRADDLIISELRLTGPNGTSDRYVDVMNPTSSAIPLSGWQLGIASASASTSTQLSSGSIPAGGHWLVADTGYHQVGPASADLFMPFGVAASGGARLIDPSGDTVDAVGFGGAPSGFSLGTQLALPGTLPSGQFTWARRFAGATPVDTLNNRSDFAFVATSNNDSTHGSPVLGAPGPADLGSPDEVTGIIQSGPVDGQASASASPNEITSSGTLIVNRTITNCTGQPSTGACASAPANTKAQTVTQLRLRIVGLSTIGSARSGQAVLKADSSSGESGLAGVKSCARGTVISGLSLDPPSTTGDGGLNSTWTATPDLPVGGLAPGACINLEFKFNVSAAGTPSLVYDTEAILK